MQKQKNYCTSSSQNHACYFRADYSYAINSKCLKCSFCYRNLPEEQKVKIRTGSLIDIESQWNKNLYKVPITIGRYCEPFLNETTTKNSLYVMDNILRNGGQIIVRTGLNPSYELSEFSKYENSIQLQKRVTFFGDSSISKELKNQFCPNTILGYDAIESSVEHSKLFNADIAIFFDPWIVDCNTGDLKKVISRMKEKGLKKIIIRQLFATPSFKAQLSVLNKHWGNKLTERVGLYWTYNNKELLNSLKFIIQDGTLADMMVGFCGNVQMHEILGSGINCCLFEKANYVYDLMKTHKHSSIIKGSK